MTPRALQLATLVDEAPEGDDWLHEQKFDGYRICAELARGKVKLLSRRFKDWTEEFPTIAAAVATLPVKDAILDGEVAAVLPDGRTSFQALQQRGAELAYFVFDVLAIDREDLTGLPLEERKARLAKLLKKTKNKVLRYSDHVVGNGGAFFRAACEKQLEGIVSKRRDAPYRGGRGTTWVKTKCMKRQELVIGGWTDPEGSRNGIGSLVLGVYDRSKLVYAGKVGTGFTAKTLIQIRKELDTLARDQPAFDPPPPRSWTGPGVHWVEPALVAEVSFTEWTDDGRLRHPSFQGLRRDKDPKDVVRE
ncbi:MAG TPA: non-homologous end-joining DNA ligase [Kofleriaceae bacterium]|nr:non-homologous end-joining DNA ligase [Kofleriaceae bacterium]